MPIIRNDERPWQEVDGRRQRRISGRDDGAQNLTVNELVMPPGAVIRLHTHPTDECIVLLEGEAEFICGEERRKVGPGHTLLAPPGTPHGIVNGPDEDGRIVMDYGVFAIPTTFFISRDGRVVARWVGAIDEGYLTSTLDALLAGREPPPMDRPYTR